MSISHCTAKSPHMPFVYPTGRQFPFDAVCEKIVRALEARGWNVPGIQVKFKEGSMEGLKFRKVLEINGEEFKLRFATAGVRQLVIPKKELLVYSDESGPDFNIYVGKNWEEDKTIFMNDLKVNGKVNGKPRMYLNYTGSIDSQDIKKGSVGKRSPYLVNHEDCGREYIACGNEPHYFQTDDVFLEMNEWLQAHVLKKIEETL